MDQAYEAWFQMVVERYPKHSFKTNLEKHPKFIQGKLSSIEQNQFGYDMFGLKDTIKFPKKYKLKGLKEKYINHLLINSALK